MAKETDSTSDTHVPVKSGWFRAPVFDHTDFYHARTSLIEPGIEQIEASCVMEPTPANEATWAYIEDKDVHRLAIEKGKYPWSEVNFLGQVDKLDHMDEWADDMLRIHDTTLAKARLRQPIQITMGFNIRKDEHMLNVLISRWSPETHSFHFAHHEATPTLEDVEMITWLPILSTNGIYAKLTKDQMGLYNKMKELLPSMHKCQTRWNGTEVVQHVPSVRSKSYWVRWLRFFYKDYASSAAQTQLKADDKEFTLPGLGAVDDKVVLCAFLCAWLSRFVIDGQPQESVFVGVLPLAVRLSFGEDLPLGALLLGTLYRHLDKIVQDTNESCGRVDLSSYLNIGFLHLWAFEHWPSFAPPAHVPDEIKTKFGNVVPISLRFHNGADTCEDFGVICDVFEKFKARPYSETAAGFYFRTHSYLDQPVKISAQVINQEELIIQKIRMWSCRCVLPAIGDVDVGDNIESIGVFYDPHRVALQLGFDQTIPSKWTPSTADLSNFGLFWTRTIRAELLKRPFITLPIATRVGLRAELYPYFWREQTRRFSRKNTLKHPGPKNLKRSNPCLRSTKKHVVETFTFFSELCTFHLCGQIVQQERVNAIKQGDTGVQAYAEMWLRSDFRRFAAGYRGDDLKEKMQETNYLTTHKEEVPLPSETEKLIKEEIRKWIQVPHEVAETSEIVAPPQAPPTAAQKRKISRSTLNAPSKQTALKTSESTTEVRKSKRQKAKANKTVDNESPSESG